MLKKIGFTLLILGLFWFLPNREAYSNKAFKSNILKNNDLNEDLIKNYPKELNPYHVELIDSIITYTKSFIGTPYKWGGDDLKAGFDCSGLFYFVYSSFGFNIPRTSKLLMQQGEEIPFEQVEKGDFLFFQGRNLNNKEVKHVAMVIDKADNNIIMIHATNRGIVIDQLEKKNYYKLRFIEARRLNDVFETNNIALRKAVKLYGGFSR